jgi:DNA-binding MarR family transcriptional regulator
VGENKINKSLTLELHRAVLIFHRRMRKARFDYNFPVSPPEAVFLTLLEREEEMSISDIARKTEVPLSKASRLAARLKKHGLIEIDPDTVDGRRKNLRFTLEGKKLCERLDSINNDISTRGICPATEKVRDNFRRLLKSICDYTETPPEPERNNVLPLVFEQIRLVRSMKMIGNDYLGTGQELLTFHIFSEIHAAGNSIGFNALVERIPSHISKVSRSISSFQKKGILDKSIDPSDRRTIIVSFTSKGITFYNDLNRIVVKALKPALAKLPLALIKRCINHMESIRNTPLPPVSIEQMEIRTCESMEDYYRARKILMEILVEKGKHHHLEAVLLPPSSTCILLEINNNPIGVIEIDRNSIVQRFEHSHSSLEDSEIWDSALSLFFQENPARELELSEEIAERVGGN